MCKVYWKSYWCDLTKKQCYLLPTKEHYHDVRKHAPEALCRFWESKIKFSIKKPHLPEPPAELDTSDADEQDEKEHPLAVVHRLLTRSLPTGKKGKMRPHFYCQYCKRWLQ